MKTITLVRISLLAVLAYLIMMFQFPLPFAPSFIELDLSDVPAILAAIVYGPIPAIFVQLIKNLLHMITMSRSVGIGELANFLYGVALVLPIGLICHKKYTTSKYVISSLLGVFCFALTAGILNYFIIFPMYITAMGYPLEAMITAIPSPIMEITDLKSIIILAVTPFNITKGALATISAGLIYPYIKNYIK